MLFNWFERRIDPYPPEEPTPPRAGLLPFLWSCVDGLRVYILALMVLAALIGGFEAFLFN